MTTGHEQLAAFAARRVAGHRARRSPVEPHRRRRRSTPVGRHQRGSVPITAKDRSPFPRAPVAPLGAEKTGESIPSFKEKAACGLDICGPAILVLIGSAPYYYYPLIRPLMGVPNVFPLSKNPGPSLSLPLRRIVARSAGRSRSGLCGAYRGRRNSNGPCCGCTRNGTWPVGRCRLKDGCLLKNQIL